MKMKKEQKGWGGYVLLGFTAFLLAFFSLTGRQLAAQGNILWTWGYALGVLGLSLFFGICFGTGAFLLVRKGKTIPFCKSAFWRKVKAFPLFSHSSGRGAAKVFAAAFFLILCIWFPVYLAYYPAICAYDFPVQLEQIVSGAYIDHHPIVHTLLLRAAIGLGKAIWHSANGGIAALALLQMLFLAAALSFGVTLLWKANSTYLSILLVQAYCMFFPFHWYMSISMTKDTFFSAFFLLQALTLGLFAAGKGGKAASCLLVCSTVGIVLFRNNGKYALLVLLFFLVVGMLSGRKRRPLYRYLLVLTAAGFVGGNLILGAVFRITGAQQGDKREMLSTPIQQLARTMVYHGGIGVIPEDDGSMEEQDKALVNDFILGEAYRNYRPDFADPVKSYTNTYVVRYRTGEFITSYFHLLAEYPGDFINAVLAVDAGYLYPGDVSHAYVNMQAGQAAGGGYVQTRWDENTLEEQGIYKDTKCGWLFESLERWADNNSYLKLPVIKWLFVPGIYLYLYLLWTGVLLIRKKRRAILPAVTAMGYFLTLLLGPTVQLRNIYPIMIVFPFWVFLGRGVIPDKEGEEK